MLLNTAAGQIPYLLIDIKDQFEFMVVEQKEESLHSCEHGLPGYLQVVLISFNAGFVSGRFGFKSISCQMDLLTSV